MHQTFVTPWYISTLTAASSFLSDSVFEDEGVETPPSTTTHPGEATEGEELEGHQSEGEDVWLTLSLGCSVFLYVCDKTLCEEVSRQ